MKEKIIDKTREIEKYLSELAEWLPNCLEDYKNDSKTKSACERHSEIIIEAIVDLAFLIIKDKKLKIPEEDGEAFSILADEGIISAELAGKLKDAKGMRNLIAHEYGKIDDEVVFNAVKDELEKDAREFIKSVKKKPEAVKIIKKGMKPK